MCSACRGRSKALTNSLRPLGDWAAISFAIDMMCEKV